MRKKKILICRKNLIRFPLKNFFNNNYKINLLPLKDESNKKNNLKNFNILQKNLNKNYNSILIAEGIEKRLIKYNDLSFDNFEYEIKKFKLILEFIRKQKKKKTKLIYINYINDKNKISKFNSKKNSFILSKLILFEILKSYREMFKLKIQIITTNSISY